jgi:osmoprotectant transport system substrate-binding protein
LFISRRLLSTILFSGTLAACRPQHALVVGSKNFTESVILGEIIAQQLERHGIPVVRKPYLGGTFVCHRAIIAGQLDIYVEYTGTAYSAILKLPASSDAAHVRQVVDSAYRARWRLVWTKPFGFDNTFAMLIRRHDAERLGISTLSQAVPYARAWRPAFGYEFVERDDGYRGLLKTYGLKFATSPATMDLGLTYRVLADDKADIIAGNSTDGQIAALHLFQLQDDRHYFPPYEAAPVVRQDVFIRYPKARAALGDLGGTITDDQMRALNYQVDVAHRTVADVARAFLSKLRE